MKCRWCREILVATTQGYRHQNGDLYKKRPMTPLEKLEFEALHERRPTEAESVIDDHVAMPIPEGRPRRRAA